jgi:hypothetical protein
MPMTAPMPMIMAMPITSTTRIAAMPTVRNRRNWRDRAAGGAVLAR